MATESQFNIMVSDDTGAILVSLWYPLTTLICTPASSESLWRRLRCDPVFWVPFHQRHTHRSQRLAPQVLRWSEQLCWIHRNSRYKNFNAILTI